MVYYFLAGISIFAKVVRNKSKQKKGKKMREYFVDIRVEKNDGCYGALHYIAHKSNKKR